MSDPMDLAAEFAALNTAVERAHQVLADLRAERALMAAERGRCEQIRAELHTLVNDHAQHLIEDIVKTHLDKLQPVLKGHMDESVARVNANFDRLGAIMLGTDQREGESLEAMVARTQLRKLGLGR